MLSGYRALIKPEIESEAKKLQDLASQTLGGCVAAHADDSNLNENAAGNLSPKISGEVAISCTRSILTQAISDGTTATSTDNPAPKAPRPGGPSSSLPGGPRFCGASQGERLNSEI